MREVKRFNKYSLILIAVVFILPLVYLVNPDKFGSYFTLFDKLSIPVWAGVYGLFWIKLNKQIKKINHQIPIYINRANSYNNLGNADYRQEQIANTEKLDELKYKLVETTLHFDFINVALRFNLILVALVKIGLFIYDLTKETRY